MTCDCIATDIQGWQGKFIVRTPDAFRCFYFLHDMTCDCIATDIQGDLDNIQRWAIMNKMVIIKRKQNLCLSSVSDSENAWFRTNIKIMIWPLLDSEYEIYMVRLLVATVNWQKWLTKKIYSKNTWCFSLFLLSPWYDLWLHCHWHSRGLR